MLTRHKDLRSGSPVWTAHRKPPVAHQPSPGSLKTDVLVIGAGISGAIVADVLGEAGFDVVLVDRRSPFAGSTSASTALLQSEIDIPLTKLSRSLGVAAAERVWRRSRLALEALRDRTHRLGIKADMQRRDALYLAGDVLDAAGLKREQQARQRAGFEVDWLDKRALFERYGIRRDAALLGFENQVADPRKLAAGYLRSAIGRGARVYAPVEVVELEERPRHIIATTKDGEELRAAFVVYATGYELARAIPAPNHSIHSTWVMATPPQRHKLWPTECMIWEASAQYLYLRTTKDGRIIVGGEDEKFADEAHRDALTATKIKTLQKKLQVMFPGVDATADYHWAGSFGGSDTGTPSIGRVPGKQRTLAVLGYGGNGITFSMLGAQILRGIISGDGDADEDLFALKR